jgi:pimeloyl-ACP methyl ester carboxylesterase
MESKLCVAASDGRSLEVAVAEPEQERTLIFHSGTPAAGTQHPLALKIAETRGVRHVTYSRPGYANSARQVGRTVADCVQDVTAIADHLGVDRFYTIGLSGGGPHALACAALMPDRVIAAATIGSVAPYDAEGLDYLAGMGEENIEEFGALEAGEAELQRHLERELQAFAHLTAADVLQAFGDLVSDADRAVLTGDFAEYLAGNSRDALAHGMWGWFDDDLAVVNRWGFDPAALARPVTIWHGHQDRFVPLAHAEWLASHIAGARAQLRPDHGHLSLWTTGFGEVIDDLIATAP